jgi:hypothetical protein
MQAAETFISGSPVADAVVARTQSDRIVSGSVRSHPCQAPKTAATVYHSESAANVFRSLLETVVDAGAVTMPICPFPAAQGAKQGGVACCFAVEDPLHADQWVAGQAVGAVDHPPLRHPA